VKRHEPGTTTAAPPSGRAAPAADILHAGIAVANPVKQVSRDKRTGMGWEEEDMDVCNGGAVRAVNWCRTAPMTAIYLRL